MPSGVAPTNLPAMALAGLDILSVNCYAQDEPPVEIEQTLTRPSAGRPVVPKPCRISSPSNADPHFEMRLMTDNGNA